MVTDLSDQRKRKYTLLPETDWLKIRAVWETAPDKPTFGSLAKIYGVHRTAIGLRAKSEAWTRKDSLALATIKAVNNQSNAIVEQTAAHVAKELKQNLADTLQPWLEREKTKHIKTQIKRSKIALRQLDRHIKPDVSLAPKESQFVAKAADTWDNIARRNLGLTDGTVGAGSLNLNILTNHSAVQINPSTGTGTGA